MRDYRLDLRGRFYSVDELQKIRRHYAHIANQRLSALEKADMAVYAYDVATHYTRMTRGSKRFSESKKFSEDPTVLKREIDALTTFLSSRTSTISGQKAVNRQKMQSFERKFGASIDDKREFWNFLSSETFQALRRARRGDSDFYVEFYLRSKEKGLSSKQIDDLLEEYRKGEISGIDELFEEANLNFMGGNNGESTR